jgi:Phage Terminase
MSEIDSTALERWRSDPIAFVEQCVINPETGKPFKLLDTQGVFLARMFAAGADGRLLYPELIYSAVKKSGKTTFAAIIVITMVLLFGGRFAEAYCVANDFEQAQSRVFEMCRRIIEASSLLKREAKVSADRISFPATGASITCLASDYASAAGGHPTIAVFDELWGYVSERSRRLWDELIPVPTRRISCRLVVSHAGFSGESVLLEELYKRGLAQPEIAPDLHAGDGLLMYWSHQPLAPWQDETWLAAMRRSLRPNQYLRMIENRFVTSESSFISMAHWDRCVDPRIGAVSANHRLPIYAGIDASTKYDSSAVVGTHWDKKAQQVRLVFHRVFQPSPDEPLNFEETIERTVLDLRERFLLRKCLYDPWQMQASAQRLAKAGVRIEEFPQSPANLTLASQNLYELIQSQGIALYPDATMRLAASRAVAVETPRGWRLGKQQRTHKIDLIVALAMSAWAAVQGQSEPSVVTPADPAWDLAWGVGDAARAGNMLGWSSSPWRSPYWK